MYGIYVRSTKKEPFARWIVEGYKTVETRRKSTLFPIIGSRVAVIETRKGHKAMVVGYVTILMQYHCPKESFNSFQDLHRVSPHSKWNSDKDGKYFYCLSHPEKCTPYELVVTKNHGYSYCELEPQR